MLSKVRITFMILRISHSKVPIYFRTGPEHPTSNIQHPMRGRGGERGASSVGGGEGGNEGDDRGREAGGVVGADAQGVGEVERRRLRVQHRGGLPGPRARGVTTFAVGTPEGWREPLTTTGRDAELHSKSNWTPSSCLPGCRREYLRLRVRLGYAGGGNRSNEQRTNLNQHQFCVASATGCPENHEFSRPVKEPTEQRPIGRGLACFFHRRFVVPRDRVRWVRAPAFRGTVVVGCAH